jgi:CHAT domain-containing protein/tetratricopeptide (TPR) repeat protein
MERKGLVCLLFLALAGPGVVCAAEEPTLLKANAAIVREIHDGEVHLYRLPLKAGDYARIDIVQQGVDVKVVLRDPAGAVLQEVDTPTGRYSREVVSFVAGTEGDHRLEVKPLFLGGAYRLALNDIRPASREDRLRIEAEKADHDAFNDLDSALLAVERWRELGDRQGEAWAMTRLGQRQINSGHYKEGLSSCEQALAFHQASGDREGTAESLYQIGKASGILGDRARAFAAHQDAISLWQELGQPESVIRGLLGTARTHERLEEFERALTAYGQALALSRASKERGREIESLKYLGLLHMRLGQPRQAQDELRAALELARGTNKEADLRLSLGALYRDFGSPHEALEHFAAALEIFKASGQADNQGAALNNLGGLLLKLGAPQEARELLLQALLLCRDPRDRAKVLLGIGQAEDQLGNPTEAEARLDEALKLQQNAADRAGEADTLRVRGFLLLKLGAPAPAREAFIQAIGLMEQLGGRSFQASARRGLALAEAGLGNPDAARKGFEEARKQAEVMGNVGEQALDLAEAGRLEHEAGRLAEARTQLESALRLVESFQSEIGGEGLRAQHFAKVRETYERYVDVLMQTYRSTPPDNPDTSLLAAAFEAAERSRARSLLDVLTRAQVDTHDGDPRLMEGELQLRLELNARAAARMALPPGAARDAVGQEIEALSAQYQIVEATSQGRYAGLTQPSIRVADIQGLLDDQTVLLEYLLGETRSYLWVVTRNSLTYQALPPRSEIESMARQVHHLLSSPSERDGSSQRQALDKLSRMVIAPALEGLAGKRLVIVADGALQYVPFAALPIASGDPASGAAAFQPLLAAHETVLLPSAAVLKEIRRASEARPPGRRSLAILADPSYGGSGPVPPSPLPILPEITRGSLAPLTWSRQEADQIAGLADGYEILKKLGPDATRELAMSGRLSHYRFLHFATHGFLDSDHPELSGLALASVDKDGHPLEGFLRLQDLYSLHLESDLVVLSGCETGLGRDLRGEGLQSLTHGFLHAGASQVIASLWPVRDRAATDLMLRLYRAMLRDGMRPAAALRAAQLGMKDEPSRNWRDPYFWAAFVAQGDWLAGADTADRTDTPTTR